jgi:metal-responsive CopG/Arc/MetJ family transcriptional regulator
MDTHPTVRVTISLTKERLDKLDRVAKHNGRTRSNAVARMIDLSADAEQAKP